MAKKIFGLASCKIGDVESDGGMSTKLTTVGETVSGTAVMTQDDNTETEFTIEESDSAIESLTSQYGKLTFAWSTYNIGYNVLVKLLGGTGNLPKAVGAVSGLGSITGGSSYVDGFYENVPLTVNTGSGTGARANITVVSGAVTAVTLVALGSGYTTSPSNTLSAANTNLGGAGSGFSVPVSSVVSSAEQEKWEAPDAFPDVEKSIQLTDKKGNVVKIPRAKLSTKASLSFAKDKLGQLDIVATVLQPTKSGEKRLTIVFAS